MKIEAGFTLLSVLLTMALISFLCAAIYFDIARIILLRNDSIHAKLARNEASVNILDWVLENPDTTLQRYACNDYTTQHGVSSIKRTVCSISNTADVSLLSSQVIDGRLISPKESFPLFDYNSLFSSESRCDLTRVGSLDETGYGNALSPGSAVSAYLCSPNTTISGRYVVKANIASAAGIEIREEPGPIGFKPVNILAAAGYVELLSTLTISADTIIVAGGDLRINEIVNSANTPLRVTLLSASGAAYIHKFSGLIESKIIAWQGVFAAQGLQQREPLLPKILFQESILLR